MKAQISYEALARLHRVWDRIHTGWAADLPCGRYDLEDGIYVNVSEYTTKSGGQFEAHRRYIDVQCILSGEEKIEVAPTESLCITRDYDETADILFGDGEGESYILRPGQAIVLLPEEAHKPGLCVDAPVQVKKAVFKVPV